MKSNPNLARVVRKARLELARLAALEPKSSASTNSATFAYDPDSRLYQSGEAFDEKRLC